MRSVRTLMHGIIDYAGLFPPAALDMAGAVAGYAASRAGDTCWALGRFVVPVARLDEFVAAAAPCLPEPGHPWKLSALAGSELRSDLAAIRAFNARHGERAVVDTLELKAATLPAIADALAAIDGELDTYVELPVHADPRDLMEALARGGARAKVRTGGITADAFPAPEALLRFLRRAVEVGVPFKATAGLHHPLRGAHRLTYAPDSPTATMFGFLNVFLAAALLWCGADDATALALLVESSPAAIRFDDEGVSWREHRLAEPQLRHVRRELAIAFGSCSFREPIDDLRTLGHL